MNKVQSIKILLNVFSKCDIVEIEDESWDSFKISIGNRSEITEEWKLMKTWTYFYILDALERKTIEIQYLLFVWDLYVKELAYEEWYSRENPPDAFLIKQPHLHSVRVLIENNNFKQALKILTY